MPRIRLARAGFTLLEMMIALAFLAATYVALLQASSASIRLSTFGKQITLATFLAQAKMEEVEEELTREGFPDMDDSDEGTFEELGHASMKWRLEVLKVELPLGEAFGQLLGRLGGEEGASGAAGILGGLSQPGGLQDLLGGQLDERLKSQLGGALGGGAGAAAAGMLNPDMLKGQVEMLATSLEQALREVRLTVWWGQGGPGHELVLTTHLVQVPSAPGAAGAAAAAGAGLPGQPGVTGPADKLTPFLDPAGQKAIERPPAGPTAGPSRGRPLSPKLR